MARIKVLCIIVGLIATLHQVTAGHRAASTEAGSHSGETLIERKITIIVADDEARSEQETKQVADKSSASSCKPKPKTETEFNIDETTKLIYIDKDSESGLLISRISGASSATSAAATAASNQTLASSDGGAGVRAKEGSIIESVSGSNRDAGTPTNFSVFLVSRHPEHIALVLDIEEIGFEPTLNCENQEIRFSIIGEISKQLLSQKDDESAAATNHSSNNGGGNDDPSSGETISPSEQEESSSSRQEQAVASLPVSEAMALLLNSPLNKTILDDSEETNDFKIIESTIDYLHEKTCNDLIAGGPTETNHQSGHSQNANGADRKAQQTSKGRQARRGGKSKSRGRKRHRHQQVERPCPQDSASFKKLMVERLREYFEWDEFKIICGKIKQLVIPMRSLKLSIYSDEFSPSASFKLRYKFISDPALLPAYDNGKYYCRNRNTIDLALKCNGIDDCGDASDESIKTCGYPSSRNGESISPLAPSAGGAGASNASAHHSSKRKLTYVNGDVLHCCQSSEWLSLMPHSQTNRLSLQSLIGDSMNLFPGPIFAPTSTSSSTSAGKGEGRRRVKRIVGGRVAQKGIWPGQASLQYELLEPLCHFCAGTLIHPQYVLTAGHCITKEGLDRGIKVVFGAHDLRQVSGDHVQVRYVDDAHIYPGVDVKQLNFEWDNDMNNDIALLRLNAPVLVTQQVAPACLPPFNRPLPVNSSCRSIGWGQTHGSGSSNLLKHLSLKVVNSSDCSRELAEQERNMTSSNFQSGRFSVPTKGSASDGKRKGRMMINKRSISKLVGGDFGYTSMDRYSYETMVCVKNDLGHGICQGDSGGPLYCDRVDSNGDKCTEIYGVASFIIQYATVGAMCAVENLPEVFGEVSSKTEWISSTMKMFEQAYKLKYS